MINIDFIIKMDIDLKNLNEDDLIKICIDKGIEYLNNKTKKIYTKSTLITRIKKFDEDNKEVKEKEEIKIDYKNEVIWTLTDEDKKNNNDYNDIESKLKNIIKSCHNYLYSNGSIVGNDASNDIITLFILKIMNYLYISNKELITEKIKDLIQNEDYPYYLTYLEDIKNICKIRDLNDINSQYEDYMDDVIRRNLLPRIFTEDKDYLLNTRSDASGICKIIGELDKIIINDITIKAFSTISIYEYFNSTYEGKTKSKKFGQFFTPRKVINAILFGCDFKKDIETFDNPTIYDPCCGTAGLLCSIYNNCSNINPINIYGSEIHKDTIKFAVASLMLSTNSLFENLNKGCALSNNKFIFENKKFDVIFTNPPFGTQTNYKSLKSKYDYNKPKDFTINFEDIFPIITNDGINLFIQLIIYSLKDNGICAIILPDGELIYSKSLTNMRKFIIDNCKILKFISVESKAFVHTQIKTNVIILKKQKGIDNHKNIEFLELNKDCDEIKLIAIADLDEYYRFKLEVEEEKLISKNENIQIKTFGEMFDLIKGTIQSSKVIEDINGFILVTGAKEFKKIKLIDDIDIIDGNNLFISTSGNGDKVPIKFYNKKCYFSCLMSLCKLKDNYKDKINIKYIYYYLLEKKEYIEINYQKGLANKSLDIEKFKLLEIPIPTLEIQEEIVKYLDELFENNNKETLFNYNNDKLFEWLLYNPEIKDIIKLFYEIESSNIDINNTITKLYELNKSKIKIVKFNPTIIIKTLGEICDINQGNQLTKKEMINGLYDVIGGGKIIGKHNIKNRDGNDITLTRVGDININYINEPYYLTDNCFSLKSTIDNINIKYIYYNLFNNKEKLIKLYIGTAQKVISKTNLKLINIPIPSLEVQEEIINYCDNNLEVINNLKKIIEDNNKMMKDLFS
jgi:type I restriction-modification system DNA methylase subunit